MIAQKDTNNRRIDKGKTMVRHEADPTTYRTVLIAASIGVLIGLLLKR